MPTLTEPTEAKMLQDSARNAQEESAGHAQALGELSHDEDLTEDDKAVLGEWALEGQGLKRDASQKVRASIDARKNREGVKYNVDGANRVLLEREVDEIAAGVDRNPPVGGRVG